MVEIFHSRAWSGPGPSFGDQPRYEFTPLVGVGIEVKVVK